LLVKHCNRGDKTGRGEIEREKGQRKIDEKKGLDGNGKTDDTLDRETKSQRGQEREKKTRKRLEKRLVEKEIIHLKKRGE